MMKEKILEAALEVYLENPHATVHDVAEKAGVSKSTVFYYFGNKKGLEKELLMYAIKRYAPWQCDTLEEAIKTKFEIIAKDRRVPKMFFYLIDGIHQVDPKFIEGLIGRAIEKVSRLLEKEGVCSNRMALFLMALLDGVAMYSVYGYLNPEEYKDLSGMLVELMKKYGEKCEDVYESKSK